MSVADAGPCDGGVIHQTRETITEEGLEHSAAVLLPSDTVCLSRTGSIGYVVILGRPMATSQGFVNWVCGPEIVPRFLQLILRAENAFLKEISSGVAHTTIYFPEAKAFHVCIPTVSEQNRILSVVDQKQSQLDFATSTLQGVMRDAGRLRASVYRRACEGKLVENEASVAAREGRGFVSGDDLVLSTPYPRRPSRWNTRSSAKVPGHAALAIGEGHSPLPPGWGWAALVDVAEMHSGHTPSRKHSEYWNGTIPWLSIPDAREHHTQTIYDTSQHITASGLANSAAQLLPAGTVSISRTASIGYVVTMGRDMATSQDFVNWTPTEAVTSEWLSIVFSADRGALESFAYGSVHKTLYFPEWLAMHIAIPPKAEQIRIAEEVSRHVTLATKAEAVTRACLSRIGALQAALLGSEFPPPLKAALREARLRRAPELQVANENDQGGGEPHHIDFLNRNAAARMQARTMRLLRFVLRKDYFSLKAAEFSFRSIAEEDTGVSPICLVGLNGSGKSNLIEVLSEALCGLELSRLPWKSVGSKYRKNKLDFLLEYSIDRGDGLPVTVQVDKQSGKEATFAVKRSESEFVELGKNDQLDYLPTRVVGYSSGLNETISLPFLRTQTFYSEEVLKRALEEERVRRPVTDYVDTRMLFSSYESNALILVANYLFQQQSRLQPFQENLRILSLASFKLHFRPYYKGKRPVRLTAELTQYLKYLEESASSVEVDTRAQRQTFTYRTEDNSFQRLKERFGSAKLFFDATYKLSLLNSLELSGPDRSFFLKEDIREGQLDRPPTVSRSSRIFDIDSIKVAIKDQQDPIDYAGLSDGEHQFIQVLGSTILFDEPGCLFLLDEPETHFNPVWRSEFVDLLNKLQTTVNQEFVISTHSPFVVSGCHGRHVFKFRRQSNRSTAERVDFETYGASYDYLLQRLFTLDSLMADLPLNELTDIIEGGDLRELREAASRFGESPEKRFLYEKIYELDPSEDNELQ